jgi:hypothetical protein
MVKGYCVIPLLAALLAAPGAMGYDYNGDGTADIGIFRPRSGLWAIRGVTRLFFGAPGDAIVPGDYSGDGTAGAGIFRPPARLWVSREGVRAYLGRTGDEPVAGDYTGDGRVDLAIFRPRYGEWTIRGVTRFFFGAPGDIPVPADYNGDGKLDPAVFRGSTGLWGVRRVTRAYYGALGDIPVPADYRGTGRAVPAVFRPSSGLWAARGSTRVYFGRGSDIPLPADFSGDGKSNTAVFRPPSGLWAVRGLTRAYFGTGGDLPVSARKNWAAPPLPALGIEVRRAQFDADHLSRVAEAGSKITRFGFVNWRVVEPSRGQAYQWDDYDQPLAEAARHGQTLVVIVGGVPKWAGDRICGPINPEALPDFADFLYAAVRRYSRPPYNVKHWELFNEPDGTDPEDDYYGAISCWGGHGDLYAEMLKCAYPAIKAADPEARVLLGALAYDNFIDEGKEFDRWFINDVLDHGGGDYFDYFNFHYYYFHRDKWGSIRGKTEHLRNLLVGYGLSKPMACSEVGIWGDSSRREIQARYVPVVFSRGLAAGLESVVWFPLSTAAGQGFEGGLMLDNLTAKPAYWAYKTMTEQLTGYQYAGVVSRYEETGIEGYAFRPVRGGRTRQVLWTHIESSLTGYQDFAAGRITVTDKLGGTTVINDGGPGDLDRRSDGRIWIAIGPSPVYVEIW